MESIHKWRLDCQAISALCPKVLVETPPTLSPNHSSGFSVASVWCWSQQDHGSNPSSAPCQMCVFGEIDLPSRASVFCTVKWG